MEGKETLKEGGNIVKERIQISHSAEGSHRRPDFLDLTILDFLSCLLPTL
jgi:hypothetical protein